MGSGRVNGMTATIFPFKDNPTFGLPVVFYRVPASNPDGPASPFVDRIWDNREHWIPPGVGMDPTSFKPYFGPLPPSTVGPLVGSTDEWANGLSYQTWLAGGYSNPNGSVNIATVLSPVKLKEAQQVVSIRPPPRGVIQAQQILSTYSGIVYSACCPNNPLSTKLLCTISMSDSGDGLYTLTWSDGFQGWQYNGAIGTCGAATGNLSLRCTGSPPGWVFTPARPSGPMFSYAPTFQQCSPLSIVFPILNSWCGGVTNFGTAAFHM